MNESLDTGPAEGRDVPSEPSSDPFEPGPANLSGCGKPAVIGCLVAVALAAAALIVLISQSPRLLRVVMEQMRSEITAALPADLGAEERERLDRAFDGAISATTEGRVDSSSLTHLQELAKAMPKRGETLSRKRVETITRRLEAIAAVSPPEPRGSPAGDATTAPSQIEP